MLTHTWLVVVASKGTLLCSYLGPCWGTWGSTWYAGYWSCSRQRAPQVSQEPDLWLSQAQIVVQPAPCTAGLGLYGQGELQCQRCLAGLRTALNSIGSAIAAPGQDWHWSE